VIFSRIVPDSGMSHSPASVPTQNSVHFPEAVKSATQRLEGSAAHVDGCLSRMPETGTGAENGRLSKLRRTGKLGAASRWLRRAPLPEAAQKIENCLQYERFSKPGLNVSWCIRPVVGMENDNWRTRTMKADIPPTGC
jgi:hypothetical protein